MINVSFSTIKKDKMPEEKGSEVSITSTMLRKELREHFPTHELFSRSPITQNI